MMKSILILFLILLISGCVSSSIPFESLDPTHKSRIAISTLSEDKIEWIGTEDKVYPLSNMKCPATLGNMNLVLWSNNKKLGHWCRYDNNFKGLYIKLDHKHIMKSEITPQKRISIELSSLIAKRAVLMPRSPPSLPEKSPSKFSSASYFANIDAISEGAPENSKFVGTMFVEDFKNWQIYISIHGLKEYELELLTIASDFLKETKLNLETGPFSNDISSSFFSADN